MKIYNTVSEDKRFEFETKFRECEELFHEHYPNQIFNPTISFNDGFITIEQGTPIFCTIDLREELSGKILISESLLEEILHEFNTSHGLYVCDGLGDDKVRFKIDYNDICIRIEDVLN